MDLKLTSLQVQKSTLETFDQAAPLILILAVAIVFSNVLIIATIVNFRGNYTERILSNFIDSLSAFQPNEIGLTFVYFSSFPESTVGPTEIINHYLLSLAVADLLCGLLIVPLSALFLMAGKWELGEFTCRFMGYLEVTLWSVSVYTFMWISVDRYLAVRKPLRYETVQTKTR